jgi:8-oxo-dGTP pyrophosphatase MutT (NUDIX family)
MIDDSILAAIRTRLDRALGFPAERYRRFVVAGHALGLIDEARVARLARVGAFRVDAGQVSLADDLPDAESRSEALANVAQALRAEGALPAWRNELFSIAPEFGAPPLFLLERGAVRYFGLRSYAAHVNGLVSNGGPMRMWLARRSFRKPTDPGLLDNLVGGGVAAGLTIEATVVKEAWEEAGITPPLAQTARRTSSVEVSRPLADGLQRETIFIHDLELPSPFVPANQDGEAIEHRLVTLPQAARLIAHAGGRDEVTVDASVVVLDYLLRCGAIPRDAPMFGALDRLRLAGG